MHDDSDQRQKKMIRSQDDWPDLAAIAQGSGFPVTALARNARGPVFVAIKVRAESLPLALPPRGGEILKQRFSNALGI